MRWLRQLSQQGVWATVRLSMTFPWTTLSVAVALAVVSIWYTSTHLTFQTSRNALVSQKARYIQHYEEIDQEFYELDALIVVIEPQRPERGRQFVQALAARLRTDTPHFSRVVDRIDTRSLDGKKLLLMSPDDLRTLRQRLADAQDLRLTDLAEAPGLQQLLVSLNQEISKALVTHLATGLLRFKHSRTRSCTDARCLVPSGPVQRNGNGPSGTIHLPISLAVVKLFSQRRRCPNPGRPFNL